MVHFLYIALSFLIVFCTSGKELINENLINEFLSIGTTLRPPSKNCNKGIYESLFQDEFQRCFPETVIPNQMMAFFLNEIKNCNTRNKKIYLHAESHHNLHDRRLEMLVKTGPSVLLKNVYHFSEHSIYIEGILSKSHIQGMRSDEGIREVFSLQIFLGTRPFWPIVSDQNVLHDSSIRSLIEDITQRRDIWNDVSGEFKNSITKQDIIRHMRKHPDKFEEVLRRFLDGIVDRLLESERYQGFSRDALLAGSSHLREINWLRNLICNYSHP